MFADTKAKLPTAVCTGRFMIMCMHLLKSEVIMDVIITEFEIGFENFEVVNIPPKYLMRIGIIGVKGYRVMSRNGNDELGLFVRAKNAERIIVTIDKVAKGQVLTGSGNELFERITRYPNITDIKIKYSDDTEEEIHPTWEDVNDDVEENALQEHYFDREGNLVIKIGKFEEE